MPPSSLDNLSKTLQDIEVIFNFLSDANNLSGADGEHVRAILARSGYEKVMHAQNLVDEASTT